MVSEQFIPINNLSIHLFSSGQGDKTLFFIHGNSSNALIWKQQMEDASLTKQYRLIAIDLPGHGLSDNLNDYSLTALVKIITGIINHLGIKEYILTGISFGTVIIGEAAPYLKNCRGIFLVSPNITSNTYHPGLWLNPFPEVMAMAAATTTDDELEKFASKFFDAGDPNIKEYIQSYKETDPNFRLAIGQIITNSAWTDEINNILQLNTPYAVIFGSSDDILHHEYLDDLPGKWKDKTIIIPNARHFVNMDQPIIFNRLLKEFADEVLI